MSRDCIGQRDDKPPLIPASHRPPMVNGLRERKAVKLYPAEVETIALMRLLPWAETQELRDAMNDVVRDRLRRRGCEVANRPFVMRRPAGPERQCSEMAHDTGGAPKRHTSVSGQGIAGADRQTAVLRHSAVHDRQPAVREQEASA